MRSVFYATVAVTTYLTAVSAHAQQSDPPRTMFPVPPLPSIGLPLPHIGLPPAEAPKSVAPDHALSARQGSPGHIAGRRSRTVPAPIWVVPPFLVVNAPGTSPAPTAGSDSVVEREPSGVFRADAQTLLPIGELTVDLHPGPPTQVFVDGYYIGSTDQTGTTFQMPAGPHDLEFLADGFEPLRVGIQIQPGRSLTYRQTLHPTSSDVTAAHAPVTLYVIPGCYAGNVAPDPASLPARCDIDQLKTITP
jgi:hypothetical protein